MQLNNPHLCIFILVALRSLQTLNFFLKTSSSEPEVTKTWNKKTNVRMRNEMIRDALNRLFCSFYLPGLSLVNW